MDNLKNKKIVIVGGAGFIGHHLALSLKQKGAEVHIIDSLQINNLLSFASTHNQEFKHRKLYSSFIHERLNMLHDAEIDLHVQDARDYHAMNRLMGQVIKPQILIHLAAVAHAGRSNKDPYSTFDHSLRTLENTLDYARDYVEHFIYFSSSMVYGHFQAEKVNEKTHCEPLGIYGALKFAGEKLVIAYHQVFDLPYTIIRPSALYGERCVSQRVGQIFIEAALKNHNITIKGDGSERLDFTYIGDLVQGVEQVIQSPEAKNEIFNLTYGQSRSVNELAKIITSYFPQIGIDYLPQNKLMPRRGTLSIEKAQKRLNYQPQYQLEEGFLKYIDWYKTKFE